MFLPYLNYTQPMSLCVLGLGETLHAQLSGVNYVNLGQRALAQFPFFAIYDRATNTAKLELGGAVEQYNNGVAFSAVVVALAIVVVLLIMIVYLIVLRSLRLKAEEWLDRNRHVLFNHANKLKTEEEILEAILASPKLQTGGHIGLSTPKAQRALPISLQKETTAGGNGASTKFL